MTSLRTLAQRSWPDYVFACFLLAAALVIKYTVSGNRRPFDEDTLQHSGFPPEEDTVPNWVVASLFWIVPLIIIIVAAAFGPVTMFHAHQHCLSLIIAYTVTIILTNAAKLQVGRPRPSFLHRCFQDTDPELFKEAINSNFSEFPFSTVRAPLCDGDTGEIDNAYKSFPSGHASYAAVCGLYITLFLVNTWEVFGGHAYAAQAALALAPVSLGAWVGLTRISDNEHHPTDVLAGFILGAIIAVFFYYQAQSAQEGPPMSPKMHATATMGGEPGNAGAAGEAGPPAAQEVAIAHVGEQELHMRDLYAAAEIAKSSRQNPFG